MAVQYVTDANQQARIVTNIYRCNGTFLKEDIYFGYVPFTSFETREGSRTLDVPGSVPAYLNNCDLTYEIVVKDRTTGEVLCFSSCTFQISTSSLRDK